MGATSSHQVDVLPFFQAIEIGDAKAVEVILSGNSNDTKQLLKCKTGQFDDTPLIMAVKKTNKKLASVLLTHGADPSASNGNGWTALHWASERGSKDLVQMLLEAGADVNMANAIGETALTLASSSGHYEIVQSLVLVKGCEVNHQTNNGRTALHEACIRGHKEVVSVLLSSKADVTKRDITKKNAHDYAMGNRHPEIAKMVH